MNLKYIIFTIIILTIIIMSPCTANKYDKDVLYSSKNPLSKTKLNNLRKRINSEPEYQFIIVPKNLNDLNNEITRGGVEQKNEKLGSRCIKYCFGNDKPSDTVPNLLNPFKYNNNLPDILYPNPNLPFFNQNTRTPDIIFYPKFPFVNQNMKTPNPIFYPKFPFFNQNTITPDIIFNSMFPFFNQNTKTPDIIFNPMFPSVNQNMKSPDIIFNPMFPSVNQNTKTPDIIFKTKFPSVNQNTKTPLTNQGSEASDKFYNLTFSFSNRDNETSDKTHKVKVPFDKKLIHMLKIISRLPSEFYPINRTSGIFPHSQASNKTIIRKSNIISDPPFLQSTKTHIKTNEQQFKCNQTEKTPDILTTNRSIFNKLIIPKNSSFNSITKKQNIIIDKPEKFLNDEIKINNYKNYYKNPMMRRFISRNDVIKRNLSDKLYSGNPPNPNIVIYPKVSSVIIINQDGNSKLPKPIPVNLLNLKNRSFNTNNDNNNKLNPKNIMNKQDKNSIIKIKNGNKKLPLRRNYFDDIYNYPTYSDSISYQDPVYLLPDYTNPNIYNNYDINKPEYSNYEENLPYYIIADPNLKSHNHHQSDYPLFYEDPKFLQHLYRNVLSDYNKKPYTIIHDQNLPINPTTSSPSLIDSFDPNNIINLNSPLMKNLESFRNLIPPNCYKNLDKLAYASHTDYCSVLFNCFNVPYEKCLQDETQFDSWRDKSVPLTKIIFNKNSEELKLSDALNLNENNTAVKILIKCLFNSECIKNLNENAKYIYNPLMFLFTLQNPNFFKNQKDDLKIVPENPDDKSKKIDKTKVKLSDIENPDDKSKKIEKTKVKLSDIENPDDKLENIDHYENKMNNIEYPYDILEKINQYEIKMNNTELNPYDELESLRSALDRSNAELINIENSFSKH